MDVTNFVVDETRVILSAFMGIALLLVLIIKVKIHPVLSLLISAMFIGLGSGMSVSLLAETIETGAGNTLKGIVLLIGLGSIFGGILEVSGGARSVAHTLVNKFGEKKAGIALGATGLIVGTTVFFEAGVMILIPLAFNLAKRTGRSTLYYVIPLLAGLATGFAFIPPSAGSVLVSNMLGVDLGVMILVGVPTGILSLLLAGILWGNFTGYRIMAQVPQEVDNGDDCEKGLPPFMTVIFVILIPLILILISTISNYITLPNVISEIVRFFGTPFVALIAAILAGMMLLLKPQQYTIEQMKEVIDNSLKPTAGILLVITGGGIISEVLQVCGVGTLVGTAFEQTGIPIIVVAFLIAGMIRICVGAAVVAMTMTAGIVMAMPAVALLSPVELACVVIAINGGASAFSHFNDSGFWLVSSLLKISEKDTLKSWTMMETIVGITGLVCGLVITAIF